tara:strand:- start:33997 stop:34326 length:330 start_codon:yes stop_codon:yes gene_type:complete
MFTTEYELYLEKLSTAERNFEQVDSIECANEYERLLSMFWSKETRFTKEYLLECKIDCSKRTRTFEQEFKWLWNSLTIDKKFDESKITHSTRSEMHKANDKKYNNLKGE